MKEEAVKRNSRKGLRSVRLQTVWLELWSAKPLWEPVRNADLLWGWGPEIHVLTSLPGDSGALAWGTGHIQGTSLGKGGRRPGGLRNLH